MITSFEIQISGTPINVGGYDTLVNQIQRRVIIFSPDAEVNIYNFAGLNKRLEIKGNIEEFKNIDNFVKSMKMYIEKQLRLWEYSVGISYQEKSVEQRE